MESHIAIELVSKIARLLATDAEVDAIAAEGHLTAGGTDGVANFAGADSWRVCVRLGALAQNQSASTVQAREVMTLVAMSLGAEDVISLATNRICWNLPGALAFSLALFRLYACGARVV